MHVRTVADWLTDPTFPGRAATKGERDGQFPVAEIATWLSGRRPQATEQDQDKKESPFARLARIKGDQESLKLQEMRRELVEVAAIEAELRRVIATAKALFAGYADEVIALLPRLKPHEKKRVRLALDDLLARKYHHLAELLEGDDDPVDDDEEDADG